MAMYPPHQADHGMANFNQPSVGIRPPSTPTPKNRGINPPPGVRGPGGVPYSGKPFKF